MKARSELVVHTVQILKYMVILRGSIWQTILVKVCEDLEVHFAFISLTGSDW